MPIASSGQMWTRSLIGTAKFLLVMAQSTSQRRHFWSWLQSWRADYLLATPSPWVTFDAIAFLRQRLVPGVHVFEYGSGGSTLFWLRYADRCISIEHDADWFARMRPYLPKVRSLDYRYIPPEDPLSLFDDVTNPAAYQSASVSCQRMSFRNYASQIDSFPDGSFDWVIIDGRARPSCLWHACRKVKKGGYLLLDDSERAHYQQAIRLLDGWKRYDFYGAAPCLLFFFQTTIWQK